MEEYNPDGMPGLYVNGTSTRQVDLQEIRDAIMMKATIPERLAKMVENEISKDEEEKRDPIVIKLKMIQH